MSTYTVMRTGKGRYRLAVGSKPRGPDGPLSDIVTRYWERAGACPLADVPVRLGSEIVPLGNARLGSLSMAEPD